MPDGAAATARRVPNVGGVVPFTTMDFPGRLAAVVFLQGCPWRCGYCHNPHLVPSLADTGVPGRDWFGVMRWLESRQGLLEGVVFSGGEPTAQRALGDAIREVRALGFAVGLHTAGAYPRRLASLLRRVDWVGLDIKAPRAGYRIVTGVDASGSAAFASLGMLRDSGVDHEVRTTVHPVLTPPSILTILAHELATLGITRWVLQPFRAAGCESEALVAAAPRGATIDPLLVDLLREFVPGVVVR